MTPKIASIIILAIISFIVVALMVFIYHFIIKETKKLSSNGLLDDEFILEEEKKEKKWVSHVLGGISIFFSIIFLACCSVGLTYKLSNEQLIINGHASMVIASNSMEDYYSTNYQNELTKKVMNEKGMNEEEASSFLANSHFNVGDMLTFSSLNTDKELELYQVYGYKNKKGEIIVHRLVAINGDKYIFRGDNTVSNDVEVNKDQILYEYNNVRLVFIGNLVLFFSSAFGIYTLVMVILIFIISDSAKHQYNKIKKERLNHIWGKENAYQ